MKMLCDVMESTAKADRSMVALELSQLQSTHDFVRPMSMPFHLPTSVYGAMIAVWHFRRPLQRRFPLHKGRPRDYLRFLAWCAIEGRRQYAILREIPDWDVALASKVELPKLRKDAWHGSFSVAMLLYGISRFRYTVGSMLSDGAARHHIAVTYWRGARHRLLLPEPAPWQIAELTKRFGTVQSLISALRRREDAGKKFAVLFETFGLDDIACEQTGFHGVQESSDKEPVQRDHGATLPAISGWFAPRLPLVLARPLFLIGEGLSFLRPRLSEFQLTSITGRVHGVRGPSVGNTYPFGVNLFGYAKGEIGIGEDVRLVAQALSENNVPFCIVNVKPGDSVSQLDTSVEHWITDTPRYAINIFCTTGIEQTRFACEQGLGVFEGRYNIGFWPWELPNWPASCEHTFSMVDEIWGISSYTANAYRNARRPVHAMSLPVTIDSVADMTRVDFGLPEDDYLFVFSFDFNSTLVRKNPAGVVAAFQEAFPKGSVDAVGMVLKASHVNAENKEWKRLKRIIDADPRIHLVTETLRRPQVLALYHCCDCYVSLHRAEGFGRGLAEALLLDLQLIATDFSGNLDFCSQERVGLVRHSSRRVGQKDYFFAHGQSWVDPDVLHAAELMRDIRLNPRSVELRDFDFSPAGVGVLYEQRLRSIQRQFSIPESDEGR